MHAMDLVLPNAVGVGFGRSGTSYISSVLREHPEVCFSSRKETHFFDRHFQTNLSAYARFFESCRQDSAKITAEWTPGYILSEEALVKIRDSLTDDVKILACYRDPIDALRSAIRFRMARGVIDKELTADEILEIHPGLIRARFYDIHVERLFAVFPSEHIWVGCFEDMVKAPAAFFGKLYAFLEIRYSPIHTSVPRINAPQAHRSQVFQAVLYRLLRLVYTDKRARCLLKAYGSDKPRWLRVVQGWNSRQIRLDFEPELEEKLSALFAPHMRNLEALLEERVEG